MRSLFETGWNDLGVLMHPKSLKNQEYYQMETCSSLISTQNVSEHVLRNLNFHLFYGAADKDFANVGYKKKLKFSISQKLFDTLWVEIRLEHVSIW